MTVSREPADSKILERVREQLDRYGITTPEYLKRRFFPETSRIEEAVSALSSVLSEPRPLSLSGEEGCYYQKKGERPLSPVALARAYAIFRFCTSGKCCVRQKLLRQELQAIAPGAERALGGGPASACYVEGYETTGTSEIVLGQVYVDLGRHPRRIVRKCQDLLSHWDSVPLLHAEREAGRTCFAILTVSREQRGRITHHLKRHDFALMPEIVVMPELCEIAPRGEAGQRHSTGLPQQIRGTGKRRSDEVL